MNHNVTHNINHNITCYINLGSLLGTYGACGFYMVKLDTSGVLKRPMAEINPNAFDPSVPRGNELPTQLGSRPYGSALRLTPQGHEGLSANSRRRLLTCLFLGLTTLFHRPELRLPLSLALLPLLRASLPRRLGTVLGKMALLTTIPASRWLRTVSTQVIRISTVPAST